MKKGTIVCFTSGDYSDYHIAGTIRLLKGVSLKELAEMGFTASKWAHRGEEREYRFIDLDAVMTKAIRDGLAETVDEFQELHLSALEDSIKEKL